MQGGEEKAVINGAPPSIMTTVGLAVNPVGTHGDHNTLPPSPHQGARKLQHLPTNSLDTAILLAALCPGLSASIARKNMAPGSHMWSSEQPSEWSG